MIELHPGERILMVCRRHWLVLFFEIARIAAGMIVIAAIPFIPAKFLPAGATVYRPFIEFGVLLFFEMLWVFLFFTLADYYLDIWTVTNRRLIFIELHGLFQRTVASLDFENIQDISTQVYGIIPTLMKYGNMRVQSAGTAGAFVFKQIGRPDAVKDFILRERAVFLTQQR